MRKSPIESADSPVEGEFIATDMPESAAIVATDVSFSSWTGNRQPKSLGTNAGAPPLAFQNWRRIKEAFAPELVARAVAETTASLGRPVRTCIDPFAGSGTTPLACQFLGVTPTAIEVNPFLSDLIEAKLNPVNGQTVAARLSEILATTHVHDPGSYYRGAPPTFVEPGVKGRYLFPHDVASRIAGLLDAILDTEDVVLRRFFRILLGNAAVEVCNATVSGKGRRYRPNWETRQSTPSELDDVFASSVRAAVYDSLRFARRKTLSYTVTRGDALRALETIDHMDLAVFSPPYPNSFDYTDIYNIELWMLRYLKHVDDNRQLRTRTMRSHVQIKREMACGAPPAIIQESIERLRRAQGLWNPWIPQMIGAYFSDLTSATKELRRMLPDRGRVYAVLGDSRYAGVHIPVIEGFARRASELGFDVVRIEPLASKRTSPQHGGRRELGESLLTLMTH